MKIKLFFLLFVLVAFVAGAQTVTNSRSVQEGKMVKIFYDLSEDAEISIYLSTDGGRSYENRPIGHVSGDVGGSVKAGKGKCAVWDVLADRESLKGDRICFKVVASGGAVKIVATTDAVTITVGGVNFKMINVEGGTFTMGCTAEQDGNCFNVEKPAHSVTLSDYYIGETEVTQALWNAVMGSNPSKWKGNNLPVETVSWDDCQDFIRKLNSMTGRTFRLPTEAEWEYAARGGKKSRGYKYSGGNFIGDVAWYRDNSDLKSHEVKGKRANELGLYDMSGNVWEWCSDWKGEYSSSSQRDPKGPPIGTSRILRGGGWIIIPIRCRVSDRDCEIPTKHNFNYGLRLVMSQ